MKTLEGKSILLVISGGIAAYKALELIRLIRGAGGAVRCVLTAGGAQFITALSVASLSAQPVYTDLWSLKDEAEMGHIRLSRECDLIVVAPASANMMAKIAYGMADDLAAATILASDKPVMVAPAMNPQMWDNAATQENIATLRRRGIRMIGPCAGEMACGESGLGRMAQPEEILCAIENFFKDSSRLTGVKALVTSGPTYEPIDPVRFIGNRSSGKQGHAIAAALRDFGADVTLVTGPVALPDPAGVRTVHVNTATEMLAAAQAALPADIAVCAAAVSDWAVQNVCTAKIKKSGSDSPPALSLKENPDILAALAKVGAQRPRLVVGFAAETENLIANAVQKRHKKGCDWIAANDVQSGRVFGADDNRICLVTGSDNIDLVGTKSEVAQGIVEYIARFFEQTHFEHLAAE